MKRLLESVQSIVAEEYGRACEKFGPTNNSDHESYAVIQEEFEEACHEFNNTANNINAFWEAVKNNHSTDYKQAYLSGVERAALLAACEMIQVAAMAYKAKVTNSCLNRGKVESNVTKTEDK
jgi:hypothetical protein